MAFSDLGTRLSAALGLFALKSKYNLEFLEFSVFHLTGVIPLDNLLGKPAK